MDSRLEESAHQLALLALAGEKVVLTQWEYKHAAYTRAVYNRAREIVLELERAQQ